MQAHPTVDNLIVVKPVADKWVRGASEEMGNPAAQVTLRMAGMVRQQRAMDRTSHQAPAGHQARIRMGAIKAERAAQVTNRWPIHPVEPAQTVERYRAAVEQVVVAVAVVAVDQVQAAQLVWWAAAAIQHPAAVVAERVRRPWAA